MAFNLVDSFKSLLTLEVVDKAAAQFGENQPNISKAISGAVPILLAGFVHRAETGDANSLMSEAKEAADNNLSNFSDGGSVRSRGMDWLRTLFGDRSSAIGDTLANYSGIKNSSAHSLLAMLAPVGLAIIGKHALDNNFSADGFRSFLTGQKTNIHGALPSDLNVGLQDWLTRDHTTATAAATAAAHHHAATEHHVVRDKPRGTNWLLILILLLVIIGLAWYFLTRNTESADTTVVTSDTTDTVTVPASSAPMDTTMRTDTMNVARDSMKVRLVNNTELNAYRGGIEERLVNCLNDSMCKAGTDQWFDFDNINFEMGSAKLTSSSKQQINNIVSIMKAYPKAKIKIGGYTDNTGDAAANKKLSQQRAETVLNALKAGGVPSSQLAGAEGYGSEFAKMPETATDEQRRTDRRIAVQLREK